MLVLVSGSGGGGAGWCSCWRHWTCRSCYLPTGRLAVATNTFISHHTPHTTHTPQVTHTLHTAHWRGCVQGWPRQCGGCSDPALHPGPPLNQLRGAGGSAQAQAAARGDEVKFSMEEHFMADCDQMKILLSATTSTVRK